MRELVEVIAKALVDKPEEVVVTEKTEGNALVLEVKVADSDMGKVFGKQGRIAKAIRAVVKAAAIAPYRGIIRKFNTIFTTEPPKVEYNRTDVRFIVVNMEAITPDNPDIK